ncbi:subtilisin E [Marinithermofilum abyssi]|uniref:Subtilisin E n=1 Tax=Marinithermofilum abyssi TaxID=1571185 RepID=A0A8J2Y9B9_9BACL|nr:S8 family peptidase [Marinithermofilum abyssi]GGE19268.1 subtilisin E [Marinithermofilum abyssi]
MGKKRGYFTFLFRTAPRPDWIRKHGGVIYHVGRHSRTVSAMLESPAQLKRIMLKEDLLYAEPDRILILPQPRVKKVFGMEELKRYAKINQQTLTWNVQKVWGGSPNPYAGSGVRVGIIDTGIDLDHPDLKANIAGGINLVNTGRKPNDNNGHGTHIAGIVAAVNNKIGVVGVAPAARLYAIKAFDARGAATITNIIRGIEWGIDSGMDILNMSFGSRTGTPALIDAVNAANRRGIVCVAAAGNEGNASGTGDNVSFPGRIPAAVAVAALNRNNKRASFSSTGSSVDIAAPGVNIFSTYSNGKYAILSGTSQATPHVSGVAAVYRQKRGGASTVKKRLRARAVSLGPDRLYGAGLVQVK